MDKQVCPCHPEREASRTPSEAGGLEAATRSHLSSWVTRIRLGTCAGAVWATALLVLLVGCEFPSKEGRASAGAGPAAKGKRVFLTVDFQPGRTLRYKFTSQRDITVDWDPNAATRANRVQEQSESFEMVVAYTPVEVEPYGASTIRATVESVRAVRSGGAGARNFGTDAVQAAQGKTFTLKVDPRGKIVDASELMALIQEMGQQAFRADTARGRIKEPDMIWDFIAGPWFLWNATSSIERPGEGVAVGQTWPSQLCVPTPMVLRLVRNVVYQLQEIRKIEEGPLAVIRSTYTPADAAPAGWPIPYSGTLQMSGTFGFLAAYEVLGLQGSGEEWFNLHAGRIEQRRETYTLRMKAGLPPMGIKADPHVTIKQTLTTELVDGE